MVSNFDKCEETLALLAEDSKLEGMLIEFVNKCDDYKRIFEEIENLDSSKFVYLK